MISPICLVLTATILIKFKIQIQKCLLYLLKSIYNKQFYNKPDIVN